MSTEYNQIVEHFWKLSYGVFIVKMVDDEGLEDEVKKLNTMHLHLGAFVLSKSKRNMNNFIHVFNWFESNVMYYGDTDSLYIENENCDKIGRACLVGNNSLHGKNNYIDGGFFFGLF